MRFRKSAWSELRPYGLLVAMMLGVCSASAWAASNTLPEPGPVRKVDVPVAQEKTLPNGLRVVVAQRKVTPLVTTTLYVKSGAEVDPAQLAGVANLSASLLVKGTATRSAPQLAQAADALGGSLSSGAGYDQSRIGITVTTPKLAAALDLVADAALHPVFAQEEIERERKQTLDALRVSLSRPDRLARLVAARAAYGEGAYGHSASGTPASLPRITRDDIARLHQTYYRPDNAVLVFAGDIDLDQAVALASKAFGEWKAPATPLPAAAATRGKSVLAPIIVVDLPGTGQAAVASVHAGIARNAAEYYPGIVANAVLGGSYSSRLNQEIRIKRGLSYGAGSSLDTRRDAGTLGASVQTKNPSAVEVVGLVLGEFDTLAHTLPPADELTARKATLAGDFGFGLETTGGLAGQVADLALYGLPLDELAHFVDKVQAVSGEQVCDFARMHLDRDGTTIVVAGDAKQFADALAKAYPKTERYLAASLDFDSATLKPVVVKPPAEKH
ncbi:MAG: insulinase family protein [Gammaproteobacteria bacterium]|nr:MAG: insulinase family protein [Gammaproteobacteria bacterium]